MRKGVEGKRGVVVVFARSAPLVSPDFLLWGSPEGLFLLWCSVCVCRSPWHSLSPSSL